MEVPIKTLTITIIFLWILLIAFSISVAYSVKDLDFSFGKLNMKTSKDGFLMFSLPLKIVNKGYYNIASLNFSTRILVGENFASNVQSTYVPVIGKGEEKIVNHNITINVNRLVEENQKYLFNDTSIIVSVFLGMKLAELIPVQASTNISMPWGAPLYNFTLEEPIYSHFNETHLKITVPINFQNHAVFDINGSIHVDMYDNRSVFLGDGQTTLNVPSGSNFQAFIEFYVKAEAQAKSGFFKVYFQTAYFNYGPMVFRYG